MAVILLASATGAPGVTTTAVALALTWPRSVLLVDCDPDPSQAVLAGWLKAAPSNSRGLVDLAQAHRQMVPIGPLLWQCTIPLTGSVDLAGEKHGADALREPGPVRAGLERHFLPGFTRPGAATVFEPVWPEFAQGLAGLAGGEVDVLVDLGRLGPRGPVSPLLAVGEVMAVVVRSSLRSLAATRLHLPMLHERLAGSTSPRLGFVVVGPARPYGDAEIEREFAIPVLADIAWSPEDADVLIEGAPVPRRFCERPLMRSARAAATSLAAMAPHPARPEYRAQDSPERVEGATR
ncbi:hypothetical protein SAMN05443377_12311 [Propionibacterium cyclohexanicum]|uniref:Cellulose biosynthesis protein BcsQ n=1 Tax=Propionibacterium cyclohexanicum TaxID=64702 RepID=A0A1H9THZ0_9ACTN|nr:hypothetical protein [Propionibacterium cyclohexanicum]SER96479.1 hypothetical protein SAMN05443377_12311 [Propionibacterium cyclohexanicum]